MGKKDLRRGGSEGKRTKTHRLDRLTVIWCQRIDPGMSSKATALSSHKKLVRIAPADISRERGLGHLCHDVKQPATNAAQEALSLTSIGNKGPVFLSPSDP